MGGRGASNTWKSSGRSRAVDPSGSRHSIAVYRIGHGRVSASRTSQPSPSEAPTAVKTASTKLPEEKMRVSGYRLLCAFKHLPRRILRQRVDALARQMQPEMRLHFAAPISRIRSAICDVDRARNRKPNCTSASKVSKPNRPLFKCIHNRMTRRTDKQRPGTGGMKRRSLPQSALRAPRKCIDIPRAQPNQCNHSIYSGDGSRN